MPANEPSMTAGQGTSYDPIEALLGDAVSAEQWHSGFPFIVRPADPALARDSDAVAVWFAVMHDKIDLALAECGAIMFRDFAIRSTEDFAKAMEIYPSPPGGYSAGATPRDAVSGRVFEATRTPPEITIMLHQEMAYLPRWPVKLAFYCNHAPDTGGETLVSDVRRFERDADPKILEAVAERGLLTTRNFRAPVDGPAWLGSAHRTWQEAFYTEDPAKAEADIADMGLESHWEQDGSLTASFRADGFTDHPVTGERHWFNQLVSQTMTPQSVGDLWPLYSEYYADGRPQPYQVRFGDGGNIALEDVSSLWDILHGETVAIPYRKGDIFMIDNVLSFHGRNPYSGQRDVQVALLELGTQ